MPPFNQQNIKIHSKKRQFTHLEIYLTIFSLILFVLRATVETDVLSSTAISIWAQPRLIKGIISSSSSEKPQCSMNISHSSLKNLNFTDYFPPVKPNKALKIHNIKSAIIIAVLMLFFLLKCFTVCQPRECFIFFIFRRCSYLFI